MSGAASLYTDLREIAATPTCYPEASAGFDFQSICLTINFNTADPLSYGTVRVRFLYLRPLILRDPSSADHATWLNRDDPVCQKHLELRLVTDVPEFPSQVIGPVHIRLLPVWVLGLQHRSRRHI
jgi:hypothetical protein